MPEIVLLIQVPKSNYTNGIAESNYILFNELNSSSKVYFFEDKVFGDMKKYYLAKLLSFLYFLKNYIFFIFKRLKKLLKPADYLYVVISVSSPLGIIRNFVQIILLLPFSKKLIIHIHRSDIVFFKNYIPSLNNLLNTLQEYIFSWSYKIIILSKEISKFSLIKKHKKKVFVLKNTLDSDLENLLSNLTIKIPKEINKTRFFFYSNILRSKGLPLYLELFRKNKYLETRFSVIAGYPNQKDLLEDVRIDNHQFLGHITKDKKIKLFSNNDCLIFCSPNEGSPLILLEAMAAGVFIISTNVGFIPELLGKNYPFMCQPNSKDFSNLIDKYFNLSKKERYDIVSKQRKRYKELFSYKIWKRNTALLFKDI